MKTIEELAREAGLADFGGCTEANIERFAALVRAQVLEEAERACMTLVDRMCDGSECVAAVRALAVPVEPKP